MRAVVIGGSGQIGGWLLQRLAERGHHAVGTYNTAPFPGLVHVDAASEALAASWLTSQRPEVVFYPAGFTWVDGCERDPERSDAANLHQPLNLARASADIGARFVYFSTDYVFDGEGGPYDEGAPCNPVSAYGRSKRMAEESLHELLGPSLLVARTSWVFGPERQGKNFAYQLVRALSRGESLTCPEDLRSNPSYAPDVARAVVELVESGIAGVIHVAGPEVISRVEFARGVAEGFGLDPSRIVARPNAELPQVARRPLDGGLKTERLQALAPSAMRSLAASVRDFVRRLDAGSEWADPRLPA